MRLTRRHILAALPITGATALGWGFNRILSSMQSGHFDPHAINSSFTKIPSFPRLPPLRDAIEGFDSTLLYQQKRPILINFWASWCIPCVIEMPILKDLSLSLDIWGITYKDHPDRINSFLNRNGQPFQRLGQDKSGDIAIEWGVTGVPESFLVFPGGRCLWHNRTGLTQDIITHELIPLLENNI